MKNFSKIAALSGAFIAAPAAAFAHPGLHALGFNDGFVHPFTGADHLMAMVAVGFWAGQFSGKTRFFIPAIFAAMMVLGAALGFHHQAPSLIEYGIAASVAVMGALIAFDVKLPVAPACLLIASFALCHGFAHGAEAPQAATQEAFFSGFVLASLILQGLGLALAAVKPGQKLARLGGALVALGGVYFLANG